MANPEGNSVRALAERYGLSIKRVDAILRLKGLEEHWKKVRLFVQLLYLNPPSVMSPNRLVFNTSTWL